MSDLTTMTISIRLRWWARLLLAIAPFLWVVRHLRAGAFIIETKPVSREG